MKIFLGADHAGFELKEEIKRHLIKLNVEFEDLGTNSTNSVDYPDYAFPLARKVLDSQGEDRGIMVCNTGIGSCIAANKVKGVRAALAYNQSSARRCRNDNDANVLCLGGQAMDHQLALRIVDVFINTPFSKAERHQRRLDKISQEDCC